MLLVDTEYKSILYNICSKVSLILTIILILEAMNDIYFISENQREDWCDRLERLLQGVVLF